MTLLTESNNCPGKDTCRLPFVNGQLSVDYHEFQPLRVGKRFGERGRVPDLRWVEYHQVGGHTGTYTASVPEFELVGWQRGHFADGVFQANDLFFANILGKNSRKSSKSSRMCVRG